MGSEKRDICLLLKVHWQVYLLIREYFIFDHLRSNCRVTNQPVWGDVYITINSHWRDLYSDIFEMIRSFRNENHLQEEVCELLYKMIHDKFSPQALVVACFYTRRGGIDINPIRASSYIEFREFADLGYYQAEKISEKTTRQ